MNIVETNLKFGSLGKRSKTTRIILHNADAKKCSAQDIHRWHKERGWAGMGYHFLVRKDGTIERGRPEDTVGDTLPDAILTVSASASREPLCRNVWDRHRFPQGKSLLLI